MWPSVYETFENTSRRYTTYQIQFMFAKSSVLDRQSFCVVVAFRRHVFALRRKN